MTGEMNYCDIKEGGEHHSWALHIRTAAQSLARRTRFLLRFEQMKPFDVYQGPYAVLNHGELWSCEAQGHFFFKGLGFRIEGTIPELALRIREYAKVLATKAGK